MAKRLRGVERHMVQTPKWMLGDRQEGATNNLTMVTFNIAKTNPENADKVVYEIVNIH